MTAAELRSAVSMLCNRLCCAEQHSLDPDSVGARAYWLCPRQQLLLRFQAISLPFIAGRLHATLAFMGHVCGCLPCMQTCIARGTQLCHLAFRRALQSNRLSV
jgi:hypothetical protein